MSSSQTTTATGLASLRRVGRLARPELPLLLGATATLGLTTSVTLLFPYASGRIMDMAIHSPESVDPKYVAGGLFGLEHAAHCSGGFFTFLFP